MEERVFETVPASPRKRRRSHKKSSKELYQQRRRLKSIGIWLLTGAVGVLLVTAIAIFAGGASG